MRFFRDLHGFIGLECMLCILAPIASAADDDNSELRLSVGFDYSSGNYGTADKTKVWSNSYGLIYDRGDYSFDLTMPYINQNGPTGTFLVAGGRAVRINGQPVSQTATVNGWGDVVAGVTRYISLSDESDLQFDVRGFIKFGTADATKGLGTGKNDYSLQTDLYVPYGNWNVLGSLGYTVPTSPSEIQLQNYWFASIDGSYKISDKYKVGATFAYQKTEVAGTPDPQDVQIYFRRGVGKASSVRIYMLKGLSNGSPSWGGGASAMISF